MGAFGVIYSGPYHLRPYLLERILLGGETMRDLAISFGKHRSDTNWKANYIEWPELVERLGKVRRTAETVAQYDAMSKADQGNVKDGPAFVGGLVRGGRRKKENIDSRSVLTLDADYADEGFLFDVELVLGGSAYLVYSTHSHRPDKHKYRVIVPCDRDMTPDEYTAVSRRVAEQIGMEKFDHTTFDVARLMYMPSCSKDAAPVFEVAEGDLLSVDTVLATYADWRDVMSWPRHPRDVRDVAAAGKKAQDPHEKQGTIGIFCRAYTIEEGIAEFLADVYEEGSMTNRYTYLAGNSGNGLEVYPEQDLAYSHQDSDPIADGRSYNLFDLVRVHKFGHLDDGVHENTPHNKRPSHTAMERWAVQQDGFKRLKGAEMAAEFDGEDFNDEPEGGETHWAQRLELHHKTGAVLPTAGNVALILSHGAWQGVLGYDAFANTEVVLKPLPWRGRKMDNRKYEPWSGADDKRLLHWFEVQHGIKINRPIQNAFAEVVHRNEFHPIKQYIEAVAWDGIPRAERVFVDYLGASDTHYVRQVTRKMLLAGVTRLYRPGAKFDQVAVLLGPQGAGKSSLLSKLGREWFSDSLRTFDNKEAGEHLQNGWIFEIGELSAMNKSDFEDVKAFLSKTEDRYRVAYDRQVSEFPRKCIFFGTTNNRNFLKDPTGNRRFWPIEVDPARAAKDQWEHLTETEVSQIWAEVLCWYRGGETLLLDRDAGKEAERQQAAHMENDERTGIIEEWLNDDDPDTFEQRTICCAAQIWVEALGRRKGDMKMWDSKDICTIMRNMPGWMERPTKFRVPGYGLQRVFERV
jgi:predicted P-loop ATPase